MENSRESEFETKKAKRASNKIKKNAIFINSLLLVLIISVALLSPIFAVKNIIVSGIDKLSPEKVIAASQIEKGKNTFMFRTSKAEEAVSSLSYVEDVEIRRKFPTTVLIDIVECKPAAQISIDNSLYVIIDKNKKILDTSTEKLRYSVPVIENAEINNFEIGEYLSAKDEPHFAVMLSIITELIENEMWDNTKRVYFEDCYLIEYENDIICDLEKGKDIPYKIKFLKETIANIPAGKKGTIEFVDDYKAVFKPDGK